MSSEIKPLVERAARVNSGEEAHELLAQSSQAAIRAVALRADRLPRSG